mmetsp:Transcript_78963/g.223466  ORF Transcript_78963/g.223466 Transcript_78963/m.223466 type:complete len:346 (-) Transcript_78963:44-1081(-)
MVPTQTGPWQGSGRWKCIARVDVFRRSKSARCPMRPPGSKNRWSGAHLRHLDLPATTSTSSGKERTASRLPQKNGERQAGEEAAADNIPDEHWDLVPKPPLEHAHGGAEHHARRDHEEVDHAVLVAEREEGHDRHPHRDDAADEGRGREGQDRPRRDHPVAEHRLEHRDQDAPRPLVHVGVCLCHSDRLGHISERRAAAGDRAVHRGEEQRAPEVPEGDEEPALPHVPEGRLSCVDRHGDEGHVPCHQLHAEDHQHAEADGEDEGPKRRQLPAKRLRRDADGEHRGDAQKRPGDCSLQEHVADRQHCLLGAHLRGHLHDGIGPLRVRHACAGGWPEEPRPGSARG